MDILPFPSTRHAASDLTRAAQFALGPLNVDPPARRIGVGDRSQMLEPRVMRVLVALGGAGGKVLSRDDLIELCWDGTIVSDSSINRVIFRLRHALEALGEGAVRLETIPRVGFRLVHQTSEIAPAPVAVSGTSSGKQPRLWTQPMTRRVAAGAIGLLGTAALAFFSLGRTARHVPNPRALDLYTRGQMLLKSMETGAIRQAIAFNKQAVELDPEYADAWGALAISYIHGLDGLTAEAKVAYPRLVRSAAERALALDPDQAEAQFAIAISYPHYRRWFEHERHLRLLVGRFPDYWYGHTQLAILLADVGRFAEAIESFRRTLEIDPMVPIAWGRLAFALQEAGRDQEADLVLEEALARWPEHVFLWVTRSSNLIEGRRYAEAIAFSRDTAHRPMKLPEATWRINERVAIALLSKDGAQVAEEMARTELFPKTDRYGVTLGWLAGLGAAELAFHGLEVYYFGGVWSGKPYAPPGPLDKRPNILLLGSTYFMELKEHQRFRVLLERTGLEDYWLKSGTQPDFRAA